MNVVFISWAQEDQQCNRNKDINLILALTI